LKQNNSSSSEKKQKSKGTTVTSKAIAVQKFDSKVDIRLHPLSDDSHDNDAYLPAAVNKCDVSTSESRAKNDRGTTSQFVSKIDRVFEYWNREMHDGIFAFICKQI
jgi:hypothetical protein